MDLLQEYEDASNTKHQIAGNLRRHQISVGHKMEWGGILRDLEIWVWGMHGEKREMTGIYEGQLQYVTNEAKP